jgi:tRNA A-37 threonylcarbamoyl transferase component Bud32
MPITAVADFLGDLGRYGLLEPAQVAELRRTPPVGDAKAMARALLDRGWLTPYQANQMLQGKGAELVLGSYVLLERLGEGGMGQVFKARHRNLGRVVALKLVRRERLANPDAVRRFQREIRAAAQLEHPHVVRAFDAAEAGGAHFFTMEYVEGTDLAHLVKDKGPLPVALACDYIRQAALGLQHAHEKGLVHRDIKPANLLLTLKGTVKVLDMGLARQAHAASEESGSTLTQENAVMGTPDYLAPEQCLDAHRVDIRADLYSLGCTLYFLLTGRPPFPGGSLGEKLVKQQLREAEPVERLRPDVPPAVAGVVRKLMAKRPEDRYQTPADLAAVLARLDRPDPEIEATWSLAPSPGPGAASPHAATPADGTAAAATADTTARVVASHRQRRQAERRRWLRLNVAGTVVLLGLLGLLGFLFLSQDDLAPHSPRAEPAAVEVAATGPEPKGQGFEAWVQAVQRLPAEQQVEAVRTKLRERNPGFDGQLTTKIANGVVLEMTMVSDEIIELSPLQALPGLTNLTCRALTYRNGNLADLQPLQGMKLITLDCSSTQVADLKPLTGMPMESLKCSFTQVVDLTPLKGMPLKTLHVGSTKVTDLSPLQGMPLIDLNCSNAPITDLRHLQGMPLEKLAISYTPVADLSPLRGMKGMQLKDLRLDGTKVVDLTPLVGMKLTFFACQRTAVTDLKPLQDMPLTELYCDFRPDRDTAILKAIPTLRSINRKPVTEVWKEVEATPPKQP